MSESQLKILLQKICRYHTENPHACLGSELALKLSAYIYQRANEIRELLWEYVDFKINACVFVHPSAVHAKKNNVSIYRTDVINR